MKVKDLENVMISKIEAEKNEIIIGLLKEKKLEIDAAKKVLKKMEDDYGKLLEMNVSDFIFPSDLDFARGGLIEIPHRNIIASILDD